MLSRLIDEGLASCDMVLMSGGTSKGAGDLCYRAVALFKDPGIVVHGVALKPGKPVCLAVTSGKPVIVLPGFPTSAIFTFHEFVAPVIRAFAGLPPEQVEQVAATLPLRVASERGRTEFMMVSLVRRDDDTLAAYPIAKGSGAVTAFSQADGFIVVGQHVESVPAGTAVEVQLIGRSHRLADLVIIGSHCIGLDVIAGRLQAEGISVKVLNVGSTGGLAAAKRGECDIAPIHLMDPATGDVQPSASDVRPRAHARAIAGCRASSSARAIAASRAAPRKRPSPPRSPIRDCIMVNRNAGSGTRILTDRALDGAKPPGYWSQPKSHNAVAVAVAQRPGRLGRRHRERGAPIRPRLHPDAGRALRFRRAEGAARAPVRSAVPRLARRPIGQGGATGPQIWDLMTWGPASGNAIG